MVLIAFCAIALVANVTNAQPVGGNNRRGRKREVGREEGGEGGTRRKKKNKNKNKTKGLDNSLWTPKKHITVQRMATPKHTESPSLVSTRRKNTTRKKKKKTVTRITWAQWSTGLGAAQRGLDCMVSRRNSKAKFINTRVRMHTLNLAVTEYRPCHIGLRHWIKHARASIWDVMVESALRCSH